MSEVGWLVAEGGAARPKYLQNWRDGKLLLSPAEFRLTKTPGDSFLLAARIRPLRCLTPAALDALPGGKKLFFQCALFAD